MGNLLSNEIKGAEYTERIDFIKQIRENETDILLEDYLEQVKKVVYSSKLLSTDVAGIILSYSTEHPYYGIMKKIRMRKFLNFEEGNLFNHVAIANNNGANYENQHNFITTEELTIRTYKNTVFVIQRLGDIVFNIRYSIPKESFVKGRYSMEVSMKGDVHMRGECIIEDNGDFYTLWSPGTSLPIPLLCIHWEEVTVAIIDQYNNKHSSGTLTADYFHSMISNERRKLAQSELLAVYNTYFRYGQTHRKKCFTYDKSQELEIFPGIKQATNLYTTPIKTFY